MQLAVVAAEDQKFPYHSGFDLESISDAVEDRLRGDRLRGASTITQQTAKNLFLWPGRSFVRKGLEAWFTMLLELCWSKARILEVYLNIAEFGRGIYGVEAAAGHFFGKPAADLGPGEAAVLAAVLPSPKRLHANRPSAYVQDRARWILEQMRMLGPGYLSGI
jgi:monofunctional biosynthetic peptidoglycan transglycosylase